MLSKILKLKSWKGVYMLAKKGFNLSTLSGKQPDNFPHLINSLLRHLPIFSTCTSFEKRTLQFY